MSPNTKSNRWMLTIYNWGSWGSPRVWMEPLRKRFNITYWVMGEEICPTTGKPHLQGYLEMGHGQDINTRKKHSTMLGMMKVIDPKNHRKIQWWREIKFLLPDGSSASNTAYCKKTRPGDVPNSVVYEWGTPMPSANVIGSAERRAVSKQGERTDLDTVKDLIKSGAITNYETMWGTSGLSCQASALGLSHLARTRPESRGMPVIISLHGTTGTGKSRWTKEVCDRLQDTLGWTNYTCGSTSKWFCGYDKHDVAVIDDLRASQWDFALLLRLLDRYPLLVEVKGGRTWWCPRVVIITNPVPHEQWYSTLQRFDGDISQLTRRIMQHEYGGEYEFTKDDGCPGRARFFENIDKLIVDAKSKLLIPVPGVAAAPGGALGAGGPGGVDARDAGAAPAPWSPSNPGVLGDLYGGAADVSFDIDWGLPEETAPVIDLSVGNEGGASESKGGDDEDLDAWFNTMSENIRHV